MTSSPIKTVRSKKKLLIGGSAVMLTALTSPAQALEYSKGDFTVGFNNHITYGAMYRTQSASKSNTVPESFGSPIEHIPAFDGSGNFTGWTQLPAGAYNPNYSGVDAAQSARVKNGNDGNLNFDGLVQNRISVLSELSMNYKAVSMFVRARAWYDDIYQNKNPDRWDASQIANSNNPSYTDRFNPETRDYLGSNAEILDAYVSGNFWIGNRPASVTVGKQVINWGESMAFSNSIGAAINPADANAGTRAGVDLKEVFMPTEAVLFQTGLTESINFQAFYQWNHRGSVLLPTGSFFAETNMLGAGGEFMWAGPSLVPINDRRGKVEDGGQYGIALTFLTDNGDEFGIYYANVHDKTPSLQVNAAASAYDVWYAEDREVFALSFSSAVGDTNLSGELSYRPNAPVVLTADCVNYRASLGGLAALYPDQSALDSISCTTHLPSEVVDSSYTQAQVSFTSMVGGTALWDRLILAGEVVGWYYDSIDKKGVEAEKDQMLATNTPYGVGTLLRAGFEYYNVFAGANLTIPMTWQYGWEGTNFRTNSRDKASIVSVGGALMFPNQIEVALTYTQYDGEDEDQTDASYYHLHDRDNVAFSFKYSF